MSTAGQKFNTKSVTPPNRSEFVRNYMSTHPGAKYQDVKREWEKRPESKQFPISNGLFKQAMISKTALDRKAQIAKEALERRTNTMSTSAAVAPLSAAVSEPVSAPVATQATEPVENQNRLELAEMEEKLDLLIHQGERHSDDVVEALRYARRVIGKEILKYDEA